MSYNKVISEKDGKFEGYITLNGVKVDGTDKISPSKIGIGSILGQEIKKLEKASSNPQVLSEPESTSDCETEPKEASLPVDPKPSSKKKEENVDFGTMKTNNDAKYYKPSSESGDVIKAKKDNRLRYLSKLEERVSRTEVKNGITIKVIDEDWASNLKFRHGKIDYSLEIVSEKEIYMSDKLDSALGVSYFDQHSSKLTEWISNGLNLKKTATLIHEADKLFKTSQMLIWGFHSYVIFANKSI